MNGLQKQKEIFIPLNASIAPGNILIMMLHVFMPSNLESLRRLTDYAVEFRYPGDFATKEDARDALRICKSLRKFIRQRLGVSEWA